jgi:hypothetical protein
MEQLGRGRAFYFQSNQTMKTFTEKQFEVEYLDGRKEVIILRRLPLSEFYQWCSTVSEFRSPLMVALAAQKPLQWADSLTDESFTNLSSEAFKVNFPRAMKLAEAEPVIAIKIYPLMEKMGSVFHSAGLTLNDSSTSQPQEGAAPATQQQSPANSTSTNSSAGSPPSNENKQGAVGTSLST